MAQRHTQQPIIFIKHEPIGSEDEDVRIDGQILAVAAANVESNGSDGELLKKTLDDGPRLQGQPESQEHVCMRVQ